jgi:hypothetical protein
MSTGDVSSLILPGLTLPVKRKDKYSSLKKIPEPDSRIIDAPLKLNFRSTKAKFDRK